MDAKIVCQYFGAVTKEEIRWHDHVITPKPLIVSEMIFRGFTCPANCGACCTQVASMHLEGGNTLDYLPSEERAAISEVEQVTINDKTFPIYREQMQPEEAPAILPVLNGRYPCKHLTLEARCGIYNSRSLACDLPLLQVTQRKQHNLLSIRKFGRHHLYTRFDMKTKGAMCELLEITPESIADTRRRMKRLNEWTNYFQFDTHMEAILEWVNRHPLPTTPLRLGF